MAQPCCYTLTSSNQPDGNCSVLLISNDAAATLEKFGRLPKPSYSSNQHGGIFKSPVGAHVEMNRDCVFKILEEFKLEATLQKTL